MERNIIFSGGGSGGHVLPAITLIDELQKGPQNKIHYIGGEKGIEREIIEKKKIPYKAIKTGKLRRYFSIENFIDIFKIIWGLGQSFFYLLKFKSKNTLVFSTGGFVSVPVVVAAFLTGKKVFIHEQTSRVGLANKLASFFADKIFISFKQSASYFPVHKTQYSGYPLRDECFSQNKGPIEIDGLSLAELDRPILFVTGGGNGSLLINEYVEKHLNDLKKDYFIIHQVGKNFVEKYNSFKDENYHPIGFIDQNMIDMYKYADIVISRAGAGTVCELMALRKRSIFIPLKIAQKNEQYFNALEAQKEFGSLVIQEDELKGKDLIVLLKDFLQQVDNKESDYQLSNGKDLLLKEILEVSES
ncbi:MAG: UDP-N-acetylglucosamine--N-acetylmuramyl-(pentapeptide) pyrophosphoryl-undecaprenol N-acetylglucosamine transferase [Bdellovibrionales bacterium]|nr:UDP-N-acetylglucosamine--N-acetylmuramyl-(pentapeptide) pyrophosphoryl-undecaprenol N-acetylglucosamine transferase [Bdellovibrionales bacterium]